MKEIPLSQGKVALVDDEDFEQIGQFKWFFHHMGYAQRHDPKNHRKFIFIHHEVLPPPPGFEIDHINGNKLDNRRINLRICNHAENTRNKKRRSDNTSGYKGVSFHKDHKKWVANICIKGEQKSLGDFNSAEEAAIAYDQAARKLFGEFARTNYEAVQEAML